MIKIPLVGLFTNNLFHKKQDSYPGRHAIPGLFDQCLVHRQLAISVHWLQQWIRLFFLHFILYAEALECLQKMAMTNMHSMLAGLKKKPKKHFASQVLNPPDIYL